jgi:hypothetical protein
MIDNVLNNLPLLKDFKDLKLGDRIYSRQYGIGTIRSLYNDEIIVQFSGLRKRLSVCDGISKMPALQRQNTKVEVLYGGQSISFKEYKKRSRLEKKRAKLREVLAGKH